MKTSTDLKKINNSPVQLQFHPPTSQHRPLMTSMADSRQAWCASSTCSQLDNLHSALYMRAKHSILALVCSRLILTDLRRRTATPQHLSTHPITWLKHTWFMSDEGTAAGSARRLSIRWGCGGWHSACGTGYKYSDWQDCCCTPFLSYQMSRCLQNTIPQSPNPQVMGNKIPRNEGGCKTDCHSGTTIRDRIAKLQERVIASELRAAATLHGWHTPCIPYEVKPSPSSSSTSSSVSLPPPSSTPPNELQCPTASYNVGLGALPQIPMLSTPGYDEAGPVGPLDGSGTSSPTNTQFVPSDTIGATAAGAVSCLPGQGMGLGLDTMQLCEQWGFQGSIYLATGMSTLYSCTFLSLRFRVYIHQY
ncbi:transcription factor xanC [Aspergillus stella-maris]|uniref:transcription factor xanC n=1 Tax=Aspergillus stella-maris TaxID=1810926 RepID=UPI003CCD3A4E